MLLIVRQGCLALLSPLASVEQTREFLFNLFRRIFIGIHLGVLRERTERVELGGRNEGRSQLLLGRLDLFWLRLKLTRLLFWDWLANVLLGYACDYGTQVLTEQGVYESWESILDGFWYIFISIENRFLWNRILLLLLCSFLVVGLRFLFFLSLKLLLLLLYLLKTHFSIF